MVSGLCPRMKPRTLNLKASVCLLCSTFSEGWGQSTFPWGLRRVRGPTLPDSHGALSYQVPIPFDTGEYFTTISKRYLSNLFLSIVRRSKRAEKGLCL